MDYNHNLLIKIKLDLSNRCVWIETYMKIVGFVVVHVQRPEEFWVPADRDVFDIGDAVNDGLAGELLHLNVIELPEVTEPLDQLRGDATVELEKRIKRLWFCTGFIRQQTFQLRFSGVKP